MIKALLAALGIFGYFSAKWKLVKSEADLAIALPDPVPAERLAAPDLLVSIEVGGGLTLNGKPATLDKFGEIAKATSAEDPAALLVIEVGGEAVHERVLEILDAAASSGLNNVSFATRDEPAE
jgi:biopolymer transport protein ExbD